MVDGAATVFVGSSGESESRSISVKGALEEDRGVIARHWRDVMNAHPGLTAIEILVKVVGEYDFGVFLLSADDIVSLRGEATRSPRDNVVFEFGLFMGSLGRDRTFALAADSVAIHTATDLAGVVLLRWKNDDEDLASSVRTPVERILGSIRRLGSRVEAGEGVGGLDDAVHGPLVPDGSRDGWLEAVDAGALLPVGPNDLRPRSWIVHPTWGIGRLVEVGPLDGTSTYVTVRFPGRGTAQMLSEGLYRARFRQEDDDSHAGR